MRLNSILPTLACISLLSILCSCNSETPDQRSPENAAIAALLDRNPLIQHGEEWTSVQQSYNKFVAEIANPQKKNKAKWKLAALFTKEARVTGEHGHYYPAAQQLTEEILQDQELDPDLKFRTLSLKAGVQLSQHHFSEALQTGQEALELNPYNAQIYGVLVDAYVELGQYTKAVEMADKMVSIRPDLRSYSRISYLREIHGQMNGAIEAMELAAAAGYPGTEETSWVRLQLGELYEKAGKTEAARAQYQRVLAERPDFPFALAAEAGLERASGRYAEAEKRLKQACQIIPEFSFYEDLASLYQEMGQGEKADAIIPDLLAMLQEDLESGHQMNLEFARIYSDLLDDQKTAEEYVLKEYQDRPENIDVNRMLASIYLRSGQLEKARMHFDKAASTNSKHPELIAIQADLASL